MPHWINLTNALIGLALAVGSLIVMAARDKYQHSLMWKDYKKRHHIDDMDSSG